MGPVWDAGGGAGREGGGVVWLCWSVGVFDWAGKRAFVPELFGGKFSTNRFHPRTNGHFLINKFL